MPDNDSHAEKRERREAPKWYRSAMIRLRIVGQVLRITSVLCAMSTVASPLFLPQFSRNLKLEDLPPVVDEKDFEAIRESAPFIEFVLPSLALK